MKKRTRIGIIVFAGLLIVALALVAPVAAGTISPGQSISAAITAAGPGGTVILNPGVYYQSGITVGNAVTIQAANGHGSWDTIVDAGHAGNGTFLVSSGNAITINNLAIRNGWNSTNFGGAIYSSGTVTVTSSTITGCSAGVTGGNSWGGAIYTNGDVVVTSSTFAGCSVSSSSGAGAGGAIFTISGVTVTSSTFTGCSASGKDVQGGAIRAGSSVTVTSSTFTGCSASGSNSGYGGAIFSLNGNVVATSSTFIGCSASSTGGAIFSGDGAVSATSSTFTGCSSGSNGGAINSARLGSTHFCRIYDTFGTPVYFQGSSDATNTWWGSNSDPSGHVSGATTSPYLVLGISASPLAITAGGNSTVSANLTYNSAGSNTAATGTIPNGTPVTFSATGGTLSASTGYTVLGKSSTTFTPSGAGTATITATVDGQSVTVPVIVTAGAATSIVIDPVTPANVYAGVDGQGIYRSTTSGGSWTAATTQPANTRVRALVINPITRTKLFVGTYGGGVYTSADSGDHWTACTNTNLGNLNVLSLVSDSSGKLYAGTENGIYSSTDCNSWTAQNTGLP